MGSTAWAHPPLPRYHAVPASSKDSAWRGFIADHGRFSTTYLHASWRNGSISVVDDLLHSCFWSWDQCPSDRPWTTRKAAQCTVPGGWLSTVICRLPTLAPGLRTHGAVWDNMAARKVGGYMVWRKEAELWCQEAAGQAAGLGVVSSSGCGAGLAQGDPETPQCGVRQGHCLFLGNRQVSMSALEYKKWKHMHTLARPTSGWQTRPDMVLIAAGGAACRYYAPLSQPQRLFPKMGYIPGLDSGCKWSSHD